jgi:demethylmenaquinone methyltransferase/2-methoxy-6-polyprenyl-1,4-benzoquinol methylase
MTRDLAKTYSRLAFLYDLWTSITETKSLRAALLSAAIRDGESVLEVAVGTGIILREVLLRNPSGRNVGIDHTAAMLRRARRKAERTGVPFTLEVGDARNMRFDDRSFDVVLSANMLGLLRKSDIERVLGEMQRVLRPGGRIVLVTMTRPDQPLSRLIYHVGAKWLGGWSDVQLEPFVRSTGFQEVKREVVIQFGIPSELLIARRP